MADELTPEVDAPEGEVAVDNSDLVTEVENDNPDLVNEAPVDPYASYGGKDAVEAAMRLHQATQTEDGVMRLFFEAGRAMGLPLSAIEQVFRGGPAEPAAPAEPEPADDDVITWGQVKQLLQREVLEPFAQTEAQRTEAAARSAVASVRSELGIEDEATWAAVLQLGDRYLGDNLSPDNVRAAVKKGHDDFISLVKANAVKYVQGKVATKAAVPKAPSGGTAPTAAPAEEPKTVEEAIKRARARLLG